MSRRSLARTASQPPRTPSRRTLPMLRTITVVGAAALVLSACTNSSSSSSSSTIVCWHRAGPSDTASSVFMLRSTSDNLTWHCLIRGRADF